jgi:DNA mismatch endonuclease (patch repair protein)
MALVRSTDTKPELVVRKLLYSLGYRYRLHVRSLPGTPDLVFRSLKKAIFVHGCFWHQHSCPAGNRMPKSRVEFWRAKLGGNVARDARQRKELRRQGWKVLVVWECEVRELDRLTRRVIRFLGSPRR